ncbi:MAG: hypothetical protein GEU91_14010 [Rhizobiales bacterium]|nr:hypothetical protein [Hyphomicrobiales bacterium]
MARWVHFGIYTGGNRPEPNDAARRTLAVEIDEHCALHGVRPVELVAAESWRLGRRIYHRLTVDFAPGEPQRPAASWLVWQHPHWTWSPLDCPVGRYTATPLLPPQEDRV